MKYLQLCFVVFSIGVTADRTTLRIEDVQERCIDEEDMFNQITLIDQAKNGQFVDDDKLKDYYLCYGIKIGYLRYKSVLYVGASMTLTIELKREVLRDWLVNKLQYDSETTEYAFTSCGLDVLYPSDIFQPIKCLSENKLPVDVVSANYVDHSVEELNGYQNLCKKEVNDLNKLTSFDGNIHDSEKLAWYYVCYSLLAGFFNLFNELNFIDLENWLKKFLKHDSDAVDLALYKCYKPKVEDINEELVKIVKCFEDEHVPIDVMASH